MLHAQNTSEPVRMQELFGALNSYETKHAPEGLYLEGDVSLLSEGKRVSVVGSRKPSPEGQARARAVTRALVEQDITVVSGLADGIDTVAHETAIELGGRTIAVLGTPLSEAYPKSNHALLDRIKAEHLAVSQFREGTPARRTNFPQRNRTMALISDATIIIEASEKSGTRHQGWEALRLGRMVFLLESIAQNTALSWPQEMIGYGAQILRRDDLPDVLEDIPNFTAASVSVF
jgi:DNA processing protein